MVSIRMCNRVCLYLCSCHYYALLLTLSSDINWGLTDEDKFEFMEHMLKVVKGKLSEVAKDIEGIPERRMKRALKQGV